VKTLSFIFTYSHLYLPVCFSIRIPCNVIMRRQVCTRAQWWQESSEIPCHATVFSVTRSTWPLAWSPMDCVSTTFQLNRLVWNSIRGVPEKNRGKCLHAINLNVS